MLPIICESNRINIYKPACNVQRKRQLAINAFGLEIWDVQFVDAPKESSDGIVDADVILIVPADTVLVLLVLGDMEAAPTADKAGGEGGSWVGEGEGECKNKGGHGGGEEHIDGFDEFSLDGEDWW